MTRGQDRRRLAGVWALALALAAAGSAAAAEFERTFTFAADDLAVADLIGAARVEPSSGNDFKVTVRVRGKDADEKWIRFEERTGTHARLVVHFPLDEYRDYVYPEMSSGSRTQFSMRDGPHDLLSELLDLARGDRIEVRGRSWRGALELWADVTVQVPAGRDAAVYLGCGEVDAEGVDAGLELRVKSGAIATHDLDGQLLADTGSGSVTVRGVRGEVDIDTGSGGVTVSEVETKGDVRVDTGSGSVRASDIAARALFIDTGSGHVELSGVTVDDLTVDTGSGGVEGQDVATDDAKIDTGSGGVDLELVRMGKGRYVVDTGSGGIRMDLPRDLSAEFDCSTGSGSIVADVEGVNLSRRQRRDARFTVGSGAADVQLSTGSGSIRLHQGAATARR
jgi:hypothetical protein